MRKHPFLLPTPKIRARSARWLTGMKTRVIRYLLGPTYTYAFLILSRLKSKRRRKKKETDNQKTIKRNKAKREKLDVTPLGQSERACYLRYLKSMSSTILHSSDEGSKTSLAKKFTYSYLSHESRKNQERWK